ncbi:hypothetical protein N7478_006838 [Penicillium angulare]|uniref:uncharacterized protein n=1 Tax=Penicillium angulare TaxID=116970 RepID=UPI002542452A|nr:uncharacterized protein N7478_006838 [Penicillium angulare]KAJ5281466.1 hypothetical protein N7478_006838 [Penicillium angulare]
MAPITKTLALVGALFAISGVSAPIEKRAVVWETVTDIVWKTVDVTTTVQPQEFIATATVVPVTTTSSEATVESTTAPKPEEHRQPATTSSSSTTSTTSTPAPAPEPTEPSTTYVAPAPATTQAPQTTEAAPAPVEPTTTAEPTTSTSAAAPAATSSSSSGSSGGSGYTGSCDEGSPCTGQMTFYDTATSASAPSACDTTNDGLTEMVLALPYEVMTDNNAYCGKTVTIEYGGVTQKAKVVDKCMGCDSTSIDLSRALFEVFDSLSAGRIHDAKWYID